MIITFFWVQTIALYISQKNLYDKDIFYIRFLPMNRTNWRFPWAGTKVLRWRVNPASRTYKFSLPVALFTNTVSRIYKFSLPAALMENTLGFAPSQFSFRKLNKRNFDGHFVLYFRFLEFFNSLHRRTVVQNGSVWFQDVIATRISFLAPYFTSM